MKVGVELYEKKISRFKRWRLLRRIEKAQKILPKLNGLMKLVGFDRARRRKFWTELRSQTDTVLRNGD